MHSADFIYRSSSYEKTPNIVYTGVRNPGQFRFDANLSKNFPIHEEMKLQLRWEAFNALNHPLWQGGYSMGVSDANFGTIERGPTGRAISLARCSWRQTDVVMKSCGGTML